MRIRLALPVLALALAASALPSAASDAPKAAAGAVAPRPLPDLTIVNFGVTPRPAGVGPCYLHFTVGVKNQGTAAWPAAQHPAVLVNDQHGFNWETGVGIDPPIPPGQTRQIQVLMGMPSPAAHVLANPHPFKAFVNTNHLVVESNYANNSSDALPPGPGMLHEIKVDLSPCKPPAPASTVPK